MDTALGTTSPAAPGRAAPGGARERILEAATELFYADGIRGVSADRIIERVGTTKATFYRHFRSKADLAVAYLEGQAARERDFLDRARAGLDGEDALRAIARGIGAASCAPGFRGCPFINAAAEAPDPAAPVRVVVDRHRRWLRDVFAGLAAAAGVADADAAAGRLMMLRDGAMVGGYLSDPDAIAATLEAACLAVVRAA